MSVTPWKTIFPETFASKRSLITGGAGFIGSHLADALMSLGSQVVVIDDMSGGCAENLHDARQIAPQRFELVEKSILDQSALSKAMAGCDYVFHQGAMPSVPRSIEHPQLYHQANVTGTLHVMEAARQAGVKRVMFAASSSAYGDSETLPKIETMPALPKSPYAANKLAGEHMIRAWASCYELDAVALRYFNIFGPRQNANSAYAGVIAAFAKALAHDEPCHIHGDGEQSRDFTFIDNAIYANLLAASSPNALEGQVINVGCGVAITVNQLAAQMAQAMGSKAAGPQYHPLRQGDVKHSLADLGKAKALLGYEPIVDFQEGLLAAAQWYLQARPW